MNQQIAVRDEMCLDTMMTDITKMQSVASKLMQTKHYAALGESGVFAVLQKAKSLNINPIDALNGSLYCINGKIGMSAEMMASMIRQKGHSIIKDIKSDNSVCVLHGRRVDNGDTWTITFSEADARKAGLFKNMYEKYPAIMLYNRAMSMLARQLFPDVIKGAGYTMEELREISSNKTVDTGYENKVHEVKFEEIVKYIDSEKLQVLTHMIGNDVELMKLILTFASVPSLEKIPESISDKIIKRVSQRLEENQKKSLEIVEENRKVMEA